MQSEKSVFINGSWRAGRGARFESANPLRGEVLWRGAAAEESDVDDACAAARHAFGPWYRSGLEARAETVRRFGAALAARTAQIARTMALETGKALWDCEQELAAAINKIEISIRALHERAGFDSVEQDGGTRELRHKPHGVVAVLGPFNFPIHLPNGHIVPALLAGNTVVFKPSELAPACAAHYIDCWREAGLDPGVLNAVNGARDTGGVLADNPGIDGLFFTGSAFAGESIHRRFAGVTGKILALELGGNNPLVVDDTAHIDGAVLVIVQSAYITAGQRCTCARRLIVVDSPANRRLIDRLVGVIDKLAVGDPLGAPQPFYGALISPAAAAKIQEFQAHLVELGGAVIRPCEPTDAGAACLRPGLVDVTAARNVPDEEAFGPLLQLQWVDDLDHAIAEANRTRFGLSAGILCDDVKRWDRFLVESRAGVVNRNLPLTGASSALPFGGIGASGNLRPGAFYAADYCAFPVASMTRPAPRIAGQLPPGITL